MHAEYIQERYKENAGNTQFERDICNVSKLILIS